MFEVFALINEVLYQEYVSNSVLWIANISSRYREVSLSMSLMSKHLDL